MNTVEILPEDIFSLIALSGDAKGSYLQALEIVREGKYEEAEALIKEANETLNEAHKVQTKFVTLEASGQKAEVGVLMVHAQDHLMNTILVKELIETLVSIQKQINELKK